MTKPHTAQGTSRITRKQSGQVLMILLILLVTGAVTLLVNTANSSKLRTEQDGKTASALTQAKEALIGYAASDANRPGELPCPDVNNDGAITIGVDYSGSNCTNLVGRLPWKTLGLPDVRDGSGERLWYAVSNKFHANGTAKLNSETLGELTITGNVPASNIIAVIFSPGPPLSSQLRSNTNINNVTHYLENDNATTGDNSFVTATSSTTFNDQLLTISNDQLMRIVEKRVAKEIITYLKNYSLTYGYPFAANLTGIGAMATNCSASNTTGRIPLSGTNCPNLLWPSWFTANNWNDVIYYAHGSLSVGTTTGVQALIIMGGRPLSNTQCNGTPYAQQTRGLTSTLCDYLDSTENTNGNSTYSSAAYSSTYNDQVFIVAQ